MKKCTECNVEMIENAEITGQHPFELGSDGRSDIFVEFIDGKVETKGIFGKVKEKDNFRSYQLKARVCPKCGKVELYVNIEE